jgi:hypothetical protein
MRENRVCYVNQSSRIGPLKETASGSENLLLTFQTGDAVFVMLDDPK